MMLIYELLQSFIVALVILMDLLIDELDIIIFDNNKLAQVHGEHMLCF